LIKFRISYLIYSSIHQSSNRRGPDQTLYGWQRAQPIDNVFIERLWRSLKYEYLYINPPEDGLELYKGLKRWFTEYETERRQKSLKGEFPMKCLLCQKTTGPGGSLNHLSWLKILPYKRGVP